MVKKWPLFDHFFSLFFTQKSKKFSFLQKKGVKKKCSFLKVLIFCHFFSFQKVKQLLKTVRAKSRRFAWADWTKIWQKMTRFLTKIAKFWKKKVQIFLKKSGQKVVSLFYPFLKSWPDFWPLFWQKHRLLPCKSGEKSGDKKWTKIFLVWKFSSFWKIFKKSENFRASKMVTRIFEKRAKTDSLFDQNWSATWSVGPRETANFQNFAKKSELFFEKFSFGDFGQNCHFAHFSNGALFF